MLKKCKVVMLATNEKAENSLLLETIFNKLKIVTRSNSGNKLFDTTSYDDVDRFQHLYFLSDEEIKKGDWCLSNLAAAKPFQCANLEYAKQYSCKKIIATTDISLKTEIFGLGETAMCSLPQPSQLFLEIFVKEYNKGMMIKEVLVEYEQKDFKWVGEKNFYPYNLKINTKNNTITIKRVKDSWNRKEHITNLIRYKSDLIIELMKCRELGTALQKKFTDDWIEQNL